MVEELFTGENQIISIVLIAIGLLLLMSIAIILFFYFSRKRIIKTELEKEYEDVINEYISNKGRAS